MGERVGRFVPFEWSALLCQKTVVLDLDSSFLDFVDIIVGVFCVFVVYLLFVDRWRGMLCSQRHWARKDGRRPGWAVSSTSGSAAAYKNSGAIFCVDSIYLFKINGMFLQTENEPKLAVSANYLREEEREALAI